jgi:hypothetical protein
MLTAARKEKTSRWKQVRPRRVCGFGRRIHATQSAPKIHMKRKYTLECQRHSAMVNCGLDFSLRLAAPADLDSSQDGEAGEIKSDFA